MLIAAGILPLAVVACGGNGADFPPPPRNPPVVSPVTLSQHGRVITVRADLACGHRPLLIARSYPHRVTLRLVNPDTNCHAEAIKLVDVSVTLSAALGARHLAQAPTGKPIKYVVGRGP